MFGLDNNSGVNNMPALAPQSSNGGWFTEGESGGQISYPGKDWFNIIQAELLAVLNDANITPKKNELNQLSVAIKALINKYETKPTPPPPPPVTSVNGKKGDVQLTAADVKALPSNYQPPPPPVTSVNGKTGAVQLTAMDVKALDEERANLLYLTQQTANARYVTQNLFASLLSGWGYQKLPSGLIMQWGIAQNVGVGYRTVTFPVAFKSVCACVLKTYLMERGVGDERGAMAISLTQARVPTDNCDTYFFALGW